jgi:hypothetical protein
LNKKEKEQLVIKLHEEGKNIRDIASTAHMAFGDIGKIIKRLDGQADNNDETDLSNRSKETQALWLFEHKKRPIDVAIELDIPYNRVEELQQEYWALKELYDLAFVYMEIKNYLTPFLQLFNLLKKNRTLSKQYILKFLRYANYDLPSLENKLRKLRSEIIELEFKKKDSEDTLRLRTAQLLDLGQIITTYQNAIDSKKQQ